MKNDYERADFLVMGDPIKFESEGEGRRTPWGQLVRYLKGVSPLKWRQAITRIVASLIGAAGIAGIIYFGNQWRYADLKADLAALTMNVSGMMDDNAGAERELRAALDVASILATDSRNKISLPKAVETARVIRRKCIAYGPAYGLDEARVLAVGERETDGFDPRARSSTGALGLMQVVGTTYRKHLARIGMADKFTEELAFDPAANVEIAIEELIEQRRTFQPIEKDSWLLTLTAYRWGPGEAQKLISHMIGGQTTSLEYAVNVEQRADRWRKKLAEIRAGRVRQ